MKYFMYIILLILPIFLVSSVYAQTKGVDIKPIGSGNKPSAVQEASSWLVDHIWLIIIFLGVGGGIILFLYIWKRTVVKVDPFFEEWKKTKELCKLNKRWSVKDVYRVSGNTGLTWLGNYSGDVILEDSTINIMWTNWKWGFFGKVLRWVFFPLRPLLKLVMLEYSILKAPYGERELKKIEVKEEGEGDQKKKIVTKTYGENIIDYVTFDNSGNVLVKAVSLSKSRNFFCPVVSSDKGEIIDTRLSLFEKEQSSALIGGLYNLTMDFANIMRERISVEPKVQYVRKTEGTEVRDEQ